MYIHIFVYTQYFSVWLDTRGQQEILTFSGLSLAPWWRAVLLLEGAKQQGLEVDRNFHGVTWLEIGWCFFSADVLWVPGYNIQRSKNLKQTSKKHWRSRHVFFLKYERRILAFVDCFYHTSGHQWLGGCTYSHRGCWYRTWLTLLGENVANRGYTTQACQAGKKWVWNLMAKNGSGMLTILFWLSFGINLYTHLQLLFYLYKYIFLKS